MRRGHENIITTGKIHGKKGRRISRIEKKKTENLTPTHNKKSPT